MSYRIDRHEPVTRAVTRITQEQVAKAIAEIDDEELDEHEAVHQVRKRCKKIRAVFRLTRGAAPDLYERENRWYRDLGRRLSDLRDAHSHLEAFELVLAPFAETVDTAEFQVIHETLVERRDDIADTLDIDQRLEVARTELVEGLDRTASFAIDRDGFDAVADGLAKTYGRARDGLTDAYEDATSPAFHEWRKRVKYHRYHVRLLQGAWPEVLDVRREELHDLTDILGDDNDLWELREVLIGETDRFPDGEPVDAFIALLDRQRARLQREAEPLGTKLFAEEPHAFVDRVHSYWERWRAGPAPQLSAATPAVPPGA